MRRQRYAIGQPEIGRINLANEMETTVSGAHTVWIGFPIAAGIGFTTATGVPPALRIMCILLPAMGFLGHIVSGIRLEDRVLGSVVTPIAPGPGYGPSAQSDRSVRPTGTRASPFRKLI